MANFYENAEAPFKDPEGWWISLYDIELGRARPLGPFFHKEYATACAQSNWQKQLKTTGGRRPVMG